LLEIARQAHRLDESTVNDKILQSIRPKLTGGYSDRCMGDMPPAAQVPWCLLFALHTAMGCACELSLEDDEDEDDEEEDGDSTEIQLDDRADEKPQHLGLILNANNREVIRTGSQPISLGNRKLLWNLLTYLIKRGNARSDYRDLLRGVWGESIVSEQTVQNAVSDLRSILKPLGVKISCLQGPGYRLLSPAWP